MHEHAGTVLYSATDLVNFLGCTHSTALDIQQLTKPAATFVTDPYTKLLQQKGLEHERSYRDQLEAQGLKVVPIEPSGTLDEQVARTRRAMADGPDVIYQGTLFGPPWHGYADFLIRRDGQKSNLGTYSYEVLDTKLSRSAKPKHVVQLVVYSKFVAADQGLAPHQLHVVLGDGSQVSLKVADFVHYTDFAKIRFESFVELTTRRTVAEPCGHCALCRWAETCEAEWDRTDHLSLVASISRSQRAKLCTAGVTTLHQLGALPPGRSIPALRTETLTRLRSQAALQSARRDGGPPKCEILPLRAGKGFARLPRPDDGDLFFDMEGDPLYPDGLEYLFGFNHLENGKESFTPFWAHDRAAEKKAFQDAVDFMTEKLKKHPNAHVYHYASYEDSALKRLAMYHGTREAEIDDFLRDGKLVDLLKVVHEGIRTSEPAYSLKNLEVFYAKARSEKVKNAGDSVVVYERWCKLRDDRLLQDIADYNEFDCKSTRMCRDWLLSLRPADADWFGEGAPAPTPAETEADTNRREREEQTAVLQAAILSAAEPEDRAWRELLGYLLEFHHRETKPAYWWMYKRLEMGFEELLHDSESIAGLEPDPEHAPYAVKRSTVYSFRFPPQDFKMAKGDKPLRAGSGVPAGEIVELDEDTGRIALKIGNKQPPFEQALSIIPGRPFDSSALRDAIYRYANAVAAGGDGRYEAVTGLLRKALPRLTGRKEGDPIIPAGADLLQGSTDAIRCLEQSYLLVQGPPGSGKTFTASHAIVELLKNKKRIGVSSNSHKAICNLLREIERVAKETGVTFKGAKKSSDEDHYLKGLGFIEDTTDNDVAAAPEQQLVAGTAWLFAREDLDQQLDYLFIDEAGQVSLANVVAMGLSAKNLVLIGDQMQLSQPMQGAHPGGSGVSALEYILGDLATVPLERGVFLEKTWRLHPDICRFISDAVYDGRLEPVSDNKNQVLVLGSGSRAFGRATSGIRFVEVQHEACEQKNELEAQRIRETFESLLGQHWRDRKGTMRPLTLEDILVVAPYNMQVATLKACLPHGARVGTVDKIQGQQAPVVLISMTTSSGEDIPRNIEFLYSRNRLNVAISRARCLAVVFANPKLLEVTCNTIEQMRLVNTLCWVKNFADTQEKAVQ